MVIESTVRRQQYVMLLVSLAIDVLIAAGISSIFGLGFLGGVGVYLGIIAVTILLSLRRAIARLLFWFLGGRKQTQEEIYQLLLTNKFPKPDEYIRDSDSYFSQVAEDEKAEIKSRLIAMGKLSASLTLRQTGQFMLAMLLMTAWERAIKQYHGALSQAELSRHLRSEAG